MKLLKFLSFLLIFVFSAIAFAQTPVVPGALASGGSGGSIWIWITAHGGPVASILLLLGSFNAICTMIRDQLAKWDGVDATQPIDPQYAKLTFFNKLALYSGKVIDLVTANLQHK